VPTLPFVRELVIGTVFIGVRATRTQGNFVTTVRIGTPRAEQSAGVQAKSIGCKVEKTTRVRGLPKHFSRSGPWFSTVA
jgi:hypothetical protein